MNLAFKDCWESLCGQAEHLLEIWRDWVWGIVLVHMRRFGDLGVGRDTP